MEINIFENYVEASALYETSDGRIFEPIYDDGAYIIALSHPIAFTEETETKLYPRVVNSEHFKSNYTKIDLPEDFKTVNYKQKKLCIQLVAKQLFNLNTTIEEGEDEA